MAVEDSTQARATFEDVSGPIVVRGSSRRGRDLAPECLVVPLGVMAFEELAMEIP